MDRPFPRTQFALPGGLRRPRWSIPTGFLVLAACAAPPNGTPRDTRLDAFLGPPRFDASRLYKSERFPNVVVAMDGSVLATWGSSRVVVRRSEDGGWTFGEAVTIADPGFHGGGTTVDEVTGEVFVFVEEGHPPAPVAIYRSADHGQTWGRHEFTLHADSLGNVPSMHMNEHGITLHTGPHRGRLVRPARSYAAGNQQEHWPDHYTTAIYSDDHGLVWHTSDPFPENGTGEAAVAQLRDGSIYYNSRVHWPERPRPTRRRSAVSVDDGESWHDWRIVDALPDGRQDRAYGCMGGLARLPLSDRDILLYSNLDTIHPNRERVTVWVSFDGGVTWPVRRLVHEGPSAYSSLAVGRPRTASEGWIYLHFENGADGGSTIARFNLTWLLEGEPTGDGEVSGEWRKEGPAWQIRPEEVQPKTNDTEISLGVLLPRPQVAT